MNKFGFTLNAWGQVGSGIRWSGKGDIFFFTWNYWENIQVQDLSLVKTLWLQATENNSNYLVIYYRNTGTQLGT